MAENIYSFIAKQAVFKLLTSEFSFCCKNVSVLVDYFVTSTGNPARPNES